MQNTPQTPSLYKKTTTLGLTLLSCSLLASCAGSSLSTMAKKSANTVARLIPSRVPVAQVRPKDLKKVSSGADRALAWDRHLDSQRYAATSIPSLWIPGDYQAPTLPSSRSMPTDGGILPPLNPPAPGQDTPLQPQGDILPPASGVALPHPVKPGSEV